jgi:hypothetical protein
MLLLCCAVLCPIIAVSIAGVLVLTVGNMVRNVPNSETLFCSNQPLLSPDKMVLAYDPVEKPPKQGELNHAGFYMTSWTSSFVPKRSCVYAFQDNYPYADPYAPHSTTTSVKGVGIPS